MTTYHIPSNTIGKLEYEVEESGGTWRCDCPAGSMRRQCVHIKRAQHIKKYGGELTVNEHLVQIVRGKGGEAPIDTPLLMGEDVQILVHGTVVEIEEKDNFDGTYDRVAKVKGKLVEKINAENGQ